MQTVLRYFLITFSLLYCAVAGIRNLLYDLSVLKAIKVKAFVISVGNLTTGGTGKTPFIISLAERLIGKGFKIGIVSRGYKRSSRGLIVVCNGSEIKSDCSESGDELMMISKKLLSEFPGRFFTVADSNRVRGSEFILKNFSAGIILLDDAFQHRSIFRNFDIVLVDSFKYYAKSFIDSFCIPSGSFRERPGNVKRADVVIFNDKFADGNSFMSLSRIPGFPAQIRKLRSKYAVDGVFDLKGNKIDSIPEFAVSFSGIASDDSFREVLRILGIKSSLHFSFNDHHDYSIKDLNDIFTANGNSLPFITTEKDSVKLSRFSDFLCNYTIYYVSISLKTDWSEFDVLLGRKLNKSI